MAPLQLKRMEKKSSRMDDPQSKKISNGQKLHIQDVRNCRLLSVTKYFMSFRNCDWQNEKRRKLFVSEKDRFFKI